MIRFFQNINKGIRYLNRYGMKEFGIRLREKLDHKAVNYHRWQKKRRLSEKTLDEQRLHAELFPHKPCFSIVVPCYNTPVTYLRQMVDSVISQSYPCWELCIADASDGQETIFPVLEEYRAKDTRIHVKRLAENQGISENTNRAVEMAGGEYVVLLDHDDILTPDALYEVARLVVCGSEENGRMPGMVYSDEDKVSEDLSYYYEPHFKPDFNLDLLRSNNYITHLCVIRKDILKDNLFRSEFDGAQDYDVILRVAEQCMREKLPILHVPKVLYHWRAHPDSTSLNQSSKRYAFENGKKVLEQHLMRMGISAEVSVFSDDAHLGFYRVRYDRSFTEMDCPAISVIIPNKDEKESLRLCLNSLLKSSYANFEIIIVENNSVNEDIFQYYGEIGTSSSDRSIEVKNREMPGEKKPRIDIVTYQTDGEFNYSAINNYGVRFAKGEYILFLNNDIEFISEDFFEEMVSVCRRGDVSVVGARLYYPDDTVQHAGIVVGVGGSARGIATNMLTGLPRNKDGYLHKAGVMADFSAVTAACMLVKASEFHRAGGFTETLKVAFNDVDLCLKIRENGGLIVYDPYVEAYHYESKSRGLEDTNEKVQRFKREIEYMRIHWEEILEKGDPYYNVNLSKVDNDYSINRFL